MSLNPNNNGNDITNSASDGHHDLFKPLQTNTIIEHQATRDAGVRAKF